VDGGCYGHGRCENSGEVSKPLANSDLVEESHPMSVCARWELLKSEESECQGNAGTQHPIANPVGSLVCPAWRFIF